MTFEGRVAPVIKRDGNHSKGGWKEERLGRSGQEERWLEGRARREEGFTIPKKLRTGWIQRQE